jgi:general secretion pathway protein G
MNRHSKRRSGGFTLIEVLLVLVILVVLFSLAVVSYGPIRKKMQKDSARTQVGLLNTAARTYEASVGELPPNLDALRAQPADVPQGKWAGPYLDRAIPLDPWYKPYQYQVPGQHNTDSFDVWTVAPDGEQIGNWTVTGAGS